MNWALFLPQRIALLDELLQLFLLLRDPVRVAALVRGARGRRRLLGQLPDVVADDGDAVFEFRQRKRTVVAHGVFLRRRRQCGMEKARIVRSAYPAAMGAGSGYMDARNSSRRGIDANPVSH